MIFVLGAPMIIYWATRVEQERRLSTTTAELARILAEDMRYPLLVSSRDDARLHAAQVLRLPDVVAVTVFNEAGGVLASVGDDNPQAIRQQSTATADVTSTEYAAGLDFEHQVSKSALKLGSVVVSVSLDRAHADSWAIAWQAALGLLVLTAVLALSAVFLSVRLFRPLSRLAGFLETSRSVDEPLPSVGETKVAEASVIHSAVRGMRERLAQDQRLLRRYADGLETMVAERTSALVAERDRAERANHAKTLFLANVSHELRTPLQAITALAGVDASAAGRLGFEPGKGILTATTQLLDLVEQLLVLSRAESGVPVQCTRERVWVERIVVEALEAIKPTLSPRNAVSMHCVGDESTEVYSDSTKIRQVLINLIRNADRYMQQGVICVEVDGGNANSVMISVRDDGMGIGEADLARIFEPFYQGSALPNQTTPGGIGLGLWLSRHIAEALGGNIDLESASGSGCTFRFRIPRQLPQLAQPVSSSPQRSAAQTTAVRNRGARILFAEDEALIRVALCGILRDAGFEVDEATDGNEARRKLEAEAYDAIVLDHWLPGMHGLELLRTLANKRPVDIPTIIFTADETPTLKREVQRLGAILLIKPVIAADLALCIDSMLEGVQR